MTPRDTNLVVRKYHQRDYKDWRRAAYIAVSYANVNRKKKSKVHKLDTIMPPWETLIAGSKGKENLKRIKTDEAIKRADERYIKFYGKK